MDPQQESQLRPVKVGILGDRKAGKTYLARKLTGKPVGDETQTTEITNFSSEGSQFVYVDTPTLDKQTIIDIATSGHYDILVFLFKECESFTKLYEFLVAIGQVLEECKDKQVRFYWQHLKKVIFIYTDYQSTLPVQIDQLFPILEEEVSTFSKGVAAKTFVINKAAEHYDELKNIIEEEPIHIDFDQLEPEEEEKKNSQVIQIGQEPIEELREVAVSGQEEQELVAMEEEPHPVHELEVERSQHEDHSDLITSKINQDKKSQIYKKIQESFFLDHEQDEDVEGVPKGYQTVDIRASTNILEEFSRPQQSERQHEIEIDKSIKQYNEEKIHKMEEQVDISEGELITSNSRQNHLTEAIHSEQREERVEESKSEQQLKTQQQSIQFKRKAELKEDSARKQRREKEEEQLYRQVVKEEGQKERPELKPQREQVEEVKDDKALLREEQINKELATQVQAQESAIKLVEQQEDNLQQAPQPQINQTYIQSRGEGLLEIEQQQLEIEQNAKQPQQHLKKLPESEPQALERTENNLAPRIKSGIQPRTIPKKQQPAQRESSCSCLIM